MKGHTERCRNLFEPAHATMSHMGTRKARRYLAHFPGAQGRSS